MLTYNNTNVLILLENLRDLYGIVPEEHVEQVYTELLMAATAFAVAGGLTFDEQCDIQVEVTDYYESAFNG